LPYLGKSNKLNLSPAFLEMEAEQINGEALGVGKLARAFGKALRLQQ
jgi:hypothetical protein